jgi:uncharacterized protein DUF4189
MPARGLFIATLVLLIAVTASAQSQNSPNTQRSSPTESTALPSDKSNLWGALAFTADGSWATAWSKPSKSDAEANVAVACAKFGRGRCEIVSFNGDYCAALATYIGSHSRRRYKLSFSGGGQSVHEAQKAAMDYCNADRRTRNCQLRTTVCGDGR